MRLLAAGAFVLLSASILFANESSTAAPTQDAPRSLPDHRPTPVALRIANDPFIAFTVPHTNQSATTAIGTQPMIGGNPVVPGPGGRIIDSPLRTSEGPFNTNPSADSVILCDTWTTHDDRELTPTAVFLVAGSSVVAAQGDLVGGYRIASVEDGSVRFDGGEVLALGDCQTTTNGSPSDSTDAQGAQTDTTAPTAPEGTTTAPMINGVNTSPSGPAANLYRGAANPLPMYAPAPTPTPEAANSNDSYGTNVYGAPAASPPPYPFPFPTRR
jgi:hypothetical protein